MKIEESTTPEVIYAARSRQPITIAGVEYVAAPPRSNHEVRRDALFATIYALGDRINQASHGEFWATVKRNEHYLLTGQTRREEYA